MINEIRIVFLKSSLIQNSSPSKESSIWTIEKALYKHYFNRFCFNSVDSVFWNQITDMQITFWMGIVAACAAAAGFSLNLIVIAVRIVKRKTMTTFQLMLCTIAFNDMVLSVLFGFMSALMLNDFKWIYHPYACKVLFPTVTHFMSVNVGCMFTVSYERYRAIVHPFKRRFSMRRTILVIIVIWALSIGCTVPNVIALRLQPYGECRETWSDTTAPKVYSLCLLVLIYVLPLSFVIAMHVIIGVKLRKTRGRFNAHRTQETSYLRHKMNRNLQTVKLLISITIAFSLFVLPTKLYYAVWDLAPNLITENAAAILDGYKSMYYIHVIVNPILYSLTNSQFRKDLADVFWCRIVDSTDQAIAINLHGIFRSERT